MSFSSSASSSSYLESEFESKIEGQLKSLESEVQVEDKLRGTRKECMTTQITEIESDSSKGGMKIPNINFAQILKRLIPSDEETGNRLTELNVLREEFKTKSFFDLPQDISCYPASNGSLESLKDIHELTPEEIENAQSVIKKKGIFVLISSFSSELLNRKKEIPSIIQAHRPQINFFVLVRMDLTPASMKSKVVYAVNSSAKQGLSVWSSTPSYYLGDNNSCVYLATMQHGNIHKWCEGDFLNANAKAFASDVYREVRNVGVYHEVGNVVCDHADASSDICLIQVHSPPQTIRLGNYISPSFSQLHSLFDTALIKGEKFKCTVHTSSGARPINITLITSSTHINYAEHLFFSIKSPDDFPNGDSGSPVSYEIEGIPVLIGAFRCGPDEKSNLKMAGIVPFRFQLDVAVQKIPHLQLHVPLSCFVEIPKTREWRWSFEVPIPNVSQLSKHTLDNSHGPYVMIEIIHSKKEDGVEDSQKLEDFLAN